MPIKKILKTAVRESRIVRYKAYKKVGVIRHRRQLDMTVIFLFLVGLVTISFFFIKPAPQMGVLPPEVLPESEVIVNPDAVEKVHFDLGDEPVEEEKKTSLADLEKRVQENEAQMRVLSFGKGDTLSALLGDEGISTAESLDIAEELSLLTNLKTLRPGTTVLLFLNNDDTFLGLSIPMRDNQAVAVIRNDDGTLTPVSHEGRVEKVTERIQGTVERTFAGSARKNGIPDTIISQITGVLDGEIDFSSDIRAGDTFDIILEKKVTESGLELGGKELLFIGLKTADKEIYRYAYTGRNGTPGFYSPAGKSGDKELYKRPVKGRTRLSSAYGRRRHPILLYEIFHHGVDLAAPKNTPIIAAADGTITQLGRKGAYGKYIRIRHAGGFQTAYGHMNGYRGDLKTGSKVKRGEVIGYIGSTGRSTGPHVHFEVWKGKKTVNPFGRNVILGHMLTGFELEQFQSFAESLHPDFMEHLAGKIVPVPRSKPTLSTQKRKK